MEKEKNDFKDSNSHCKCYINGLKAFIFSLKETFIYCSHIAEIAEKPKPESHPVNDGIQYKLNAQPHCISMVKMRELMGKERYPGS